MRRRRAVDVVGIGGGEVVHADADAVHAAGKSRLEGTRLRILEKAEQMIIESDTVRTGPAAPREDSGAKQA